MMLSQLKYFREVQLDGIKMMDVAAYKVNRRGEWGSLGPVSKYHPKTRLEENQGN
jgi:hypothetical protein